VKKIKKQSQHQEHGSKQSKAKTTDTFDELKKIAKELRLGAFKLAMEFGEGHIAPSLSPVEIIVVLYERVMKPANKDKFILSKGHGCLGWYCMLKRKGYSPHATPHPDIEVCQGIECTTGSLGHGLPIGVGMALARKIKKEKGRIFVLIGDGECQEGSIWESLNLARRYNLDNLTIIVDHNKLQALSSVKEILDEQNLKAKFEAFGCNTSEIDGHDSSQVLDALDEKHNKKEVPRAIIAHTIKGKGLSFMENVAKWHTGIPAGELVDQAYKELACKGAKK
jgi:transketolase